MPDRSDRDQLRVTQVRSAIGTKPKHRGTLRALGLRGIGQSNVLPDRPEIRGMIARVPHLITVDAVGAPAGKTSTAAEGTKAPSRKRSTAPGGAGAPALGEEDGVGAPSGKRRQSDEGS